MTNRLNDYDDAALVSAINQDDQVMGFRIVYARRDILRMHYREQRRRMDSVNALSRMIELDSAMRTRQDIEAAIPIVEQLFANQATKTFVLDTLQFGQAETMARLNLDRRQFAAKLRRAEKYCCQHRQKIIGLISSRQDKKDVVERELLQSLHDLLADSETNDEDVMVWINSNREYCEELMGEISGINHQLLMLNDFSKCDHAEQYRLINALELKLVYLNKKLVNA